MVTVNRGQYVINTVFLAKGHDYAVVVGIKQIMLQALNDKACGVILCHNHPSGNRNPSTEDVKLTKNVKEGLKLFDIPLLEHIIIAKDNDYYSMADEGIL